MELILAATLAALLGVSAHRAGLCTVKAVVEVFTSRQGWFLYSFVKAVLWTTGILGFATWLGAGPELVARPLFWTTVTGGFLFGVGAGINRACVFSTLSLLAEGRVAMLVTVLGWLVGIRLSEFLDAPPEAPSTTTALPTWLVAAILLWIVWEAFRLAKITFQSRFRVFLSDFWPLSFAVALVAISNAVLQLLDLRWTFTNVFLCSVKADAGGSCTDQSILAVLAGAAFAGMVGSAIARKSFHFQPAGLGSIFRKGVAGTMMGAGIGLIPGGNDGLILFGLPSLSISSFVAFIAILLGVATVVVISRFTGHTMPVIKCTADTCKVNL